MNSQQIEELGAVIKRHRFHIQSEAIRAIADWLCQTVPHFDRSQWYAQIDGKAWQPKTGQACSCRKGQERDNCPQCEGTGQRIDFKAIRERLAR